LRSRWFTGALLCATALAACGDDGQPSPSPSLVYAETDDNSMGRIVRTTADGEQRQVLWTGPNDVGSPLYPSPDGRNVLFVGDYVWQLLPLDGRPAVPFTLPDISASRPDWAPDAASIAWIATVPEAPYISRVIVAPAGGTTFQVLTPDTIQMVSASWSPDGSTILACGSLTSGYGAGRLYLVNRDGSNLHQLTPDSLQVQCGEAWSPSGDRIAFAAGYLWTIAPDGTGLRRLPSEPPYRQGGFGPSVFWSPDGLFLLATGRDYHALSRIRVDNGATLGLDLQAPTGDPWAPSGRMILFSGLTPFIEGEPFGGQRPTVNVASPDGKSRVQVSTDTVNGFSSAWLPEPE
jgi:Tol biopolymer transport system component